MGRVRQHRKKRPSNPTALETEGPNHFWRVDTCFDCAENRSRLEMMAIQDEFTKEPLDLEVGRRLRSLHLQSVLSRLFEERGALKFLRLDNGPEFISHSLAVVLARSGSMSRFITLGSPW